MSVLHKYKRAFFITLIIPLLAVYISACAPVVKPVQAWLPFGHTGVTLAQLGGLPVVVVNLYNIAGPGAAIHLYIEGDGAAFTPQGLPSRNPTPRTPVALQLALNDSSGARVIYLGRPCQWVDVAQHPTCTPAAYTAQRFTPAMLVGYTKLIKQLADNQPTTLIGHSGGAWLAYGVAQQLPQVTQVIAVAGNLNPALVNQHHKVPAIPQARWPTPLRRVPLVYVAGGRDNIIPPKLAQKMLAPLPAGCTYLQEINTATHTQGFNAPWPVLLQIAPTTCAAP